MKLKKSVWENRGFGNPSSKALKAGIEARIRAIIAFLGEIEVRLDQIEDLIKDLHKKELGA